MRSSISSAQPNAGDVTIFGAYDGYEIVSFDDQIGAHGAAGGNQLHPFLIGPAHLQLETRASTTRETFTGSIVKRYAAALARVPGLGARADRSRAAARRATRPASSLVASSTRRRRAAGRRGVAIVGTTRGALADADGRFVISGRPGRRTTIRARLLGYKPRSTGRSSCAPATRRASSLRLETEAPVLGAVRTEARPVERDAFDSRPSVGTVQITARAAEGVPKFGEPDIIRIVQLLPGVEARNDFSTGFNVRGGESDQNLILLDGYPIYNPFHLGGLFSTFIDPTVRRRDADDRRIPGALRRTSVGVLDVHSAEEVRAGHARHGRAVGAGVDRRAGRLVRPREGDVDDRRTSDVRRQVRRSDQHEELPYHFRDEQVHFTYAFTPTTKLSITAYDGRDALDANIATFGDSTGANASGGTFLFDWGNRVIGASLTKRRLARSPGVAVAVRRQHDARAACVALDVLDAARPRRRFADAAQHGDRSPARRQRHDAHRAHERIDRLRRRVVRHRLRRDVAAVGRAPLRSAPVADIGRAVLRRRVARSPSWLLETGVRAEALTTRLAGSASRRGCRRSISSRGLGADRRRSAASRSGRTRWRAKTFRCACSTSGSRATR